jgi:peptidoglycan-N-acetylglucosamine deacetylase
VNARDAIVNGASAVAWAEGMSCAVSLCFDDGKLSQIALAAPLLQRYDIHASFYLPTSWMIGPNVASIKYMIQQWRAIQAAGHEIGNHTVAHPCSTNFPVENHIRSPLESMSLAEMREEIDEAQRMLQSEIGVMPVTFAYPCGMAFVGRGTHCESYVPLVAERFIVGRSYNEECAAAPLRCDLARVPAIRIDNRPLPELLTLINQASRSGDWLIFVAHSIVRKSSPLSVELPILESLLAHLAARKGSVWVDTVEKVGRYLRIIQKAHFAGNFTSAHN